MVHYCKEESCCKEGRQTTVAEICRTLTAILLRARPIIPQLSRWAKSLGCLYFFLAGVGDTWSSAALALNGPDGEARPSPRQNGGWPEGSLGPDRPFG